MIGSYHSTVLRYLTYFSTPVDITPPTSGTITVTAISSTQITVAVNGDASDANGIDHYTLEWSPNGSTGWTSLETNWNGSTRPHTGLTAATPYYYRVYAFDPSNNQSVTPATGNATTLAAGSVTPIFNTDFTNYAVGTNFVAANSGGQGSNSLWSVGSSQDNLVANDPLGQMGKVLMQRIPDNTTDFGCGASIPGLVNLTDGDEVWCRVWVLLPTGFAGDCHNPPIAGCSDTLKFIRFETGGLASNPSAKLDFNRPRLNFSNPVGGIIAVESVPTRSVDPGLPDPGNDIGIWTCHEVYALLKADGTGRVRWWHNDVLKADYAFQTFDQLGEVLNGSLFMLAYWNGGATDNASDPSYVGQTMYTTRWTVCTGAIPPTNTDSFGNPFIGSGYFSSVEKLT